MADCARAPLAVLSLSLKIRFWASFVCAFLLVACSDQKTQTHSEQIPAPGFQTKPQVYMVFDPELAPFNLPNPDALSAQLNAHVEVFQSSDDESLKNKIKEFNARPSDLVLVGPRKVPAQESLSLIQHPKRKLNLVMVTAPKSTLPSKGRDSLVHLDMEEVESSLEGLRLATKKMGLGENAVAWASNENKAAILVRINWKLWLEQALKSINTSSSNPYDGKVWKDLSFGSNNLEIRINDASHSHDPKTTKAINKVVQDFRMSQLGPGDKGDLE